MRRSSSCSGSAISSSTGSTFDAALEEIRQTHGLHDAHAGRRPATTRSRSHLVEKHLAGCWGTLGANRDRFLALGVVRQRRRPAVQHDGARAAVGRQGQRASAELHGRRDARRCGRRCGRASPKTDRPVGSVTNGVHVPTWIAAELADLFSKHLGRRLARSPRRPGAVGRRARDSRRRALGGPPGAAALSVHLRARARAPALDRRARRHAARRRRRHAARPRRADHRLRAPLRRLQAARADLPRSRAAGAHPQRAGAARSRSSSPASRIRPTTSASITCSASTSARSIRCSAAASPSSTTTICTSRTSSCRAATSG